MERSLECPQQVPGRIWWNAVTFHLYLGRFILWPHLHSPHERLAQANIPQDTGPFKEPRHCCPSYVRCPPSSSLSQTPLLPGFSLRVTSSSTIFRAPIRLSLPVSISTFQDRSFVLFVCLFFNIPTFFQNRKTGGFFVFQDQKLNLAPNKHLLNVCCYKKKKKRNDLSKYESLTFQKQRNQHQHPHLFINLEFLFN